jgi:hypothetical protein
MTVVYSLSPHIVDGRQQDLIAARPLHAPRTRRLPSALRGAWRLRRAPRHAAA